MSAHKKELAALKIVLEALDTGSLASSDYSALEGLSERWGKDIDAIQSGRACSAPSEFFRDHNHFCPQYVIGECKRQLDEIIAKQNEGRSGE